MMVDAVEVMIIANLIAIIIINASVLLKISIVRLMMDAMIVTIIQTKIGMLHFLHMTHNFPEWASIE